MVRVIRRLIQLFALIVILLIPYLNEKQINLLMGNLYSSTIFGIDISDPLMVMQNILLSYSFELKFFLTAIIPIFLALIFGRVFCSFLCPVNTIFEWLNTLYPKKKQIQVKGSGKITYIFICLLIILVLLAKYPLFTYLSLPGALSIELQNTIMSKSLSIFWVILLFLIFLDFVIKRRFWCNFVCPQGIFISLLRGPKTMKIIRNINSSSKCTGCKKCTSSCPLYLNPMEEKIYPQCINCLECVMVCRKNHKENAPLKIKF